MSKNYQKHLLSIDDLGWKLHEVDNSQNWDGLSKFYLEQCYKNPGLLKLTYFKNWYNAVKLSLEN